MAISTAANVAKYIIYKSLQRKEPVSNLKLQKLLYFIQGSCLVINDEQAFDDDIVAWRYGPVVKSVYYTYSVYGANDIITTFEEEITLPQHLKEVVDFVLDNLLPVSAITLVNETHLDGSPWKEVNINEKLSISSIKSYFKKHYLG